MNLKELLVSFLVISLLLGNFTPTVISEYSFEIGSQLLIEENTNEIQKALYNEVKDSSLDYESFGNQETFWMYNFHDESLYQINATLLAVGNWSYIYVDNETIEQDGISKWIKDCEFYRDEFDSTIYPKAVEYAGHPDGNMGDVDGDPHVTILFSPIYGATGYYAYVNEMTIHYYSNRREMIFIHSGIDLFEVMITIPHEFNHLIWSNFDTDGAPFLMEGGAEYATYYTGYLANSSYLIAGQDYNLTDFAPNFALHPELSLLCFDRENDDTRVHYGSSYMFYFYFAEKYGLEAAQDLIHVQEDGVQAIEYVLANHGYMIPFNGLYLDWITACALDLEGVEGNIYSFDNANFKITSVTEIPETRYKKEDLLYQYYGFDVKRLIEPEDEFTLRVTSPRDDYGLGTVIAIHDTNGWNITQNLYFGESDKITVHISGDQIDEAYIITSMMKNSPRAPTISYPAPKDNLDFEILEGHIQPEESTEESNLSFIVILTAFVSVISLEFLVKKSKKNY